jgi:hypothetical protein
MEPTERDHLFEAWLAASSISAKERAHIAVHLADLALVYKQGDLYGCGKVLAELGVWLTKLPAEPPKLATRNQ